MFYLTVLCLAALVYGSKVQPEEGDTVYLTKIVGGSSVSESLYRSTYPSLAQPSGSQTGSSFCTATVIGRRWILWAAHCVHSSTRWVRVGAAREGSGTAYSVVRQISHPSYNTRTMFADIALIEVSSDISAPIAQVAGFNHFSSLNYLGQQATAVGWGWLSEDTPPPGTLHHVQMGIDRSCSATGDICTTGNSMSNPRGWRTCTCYGDSGGPLIYQGVVLGVVSRGPAPCELGDTYYASTEYHGSWLQSTVTSKSGEVNGTVTYPRPLYNVDNALQSGEDCLSSWRVIYAIAQLRVVDAALEATKQALDVIAETSDLNTQLVIGQVIQELLIDEVVLVENVNNILNSACALCSSIHSEFDMAISTIVPFMSAIDPDWERSDTWAPVNGFNQVLRATSSTIC